MRVPNAERVLDTVTFVASFARCLALTAMFLLSCSLPQQAAADEEPELRATISADEIFVGESVDLQVEVRNTQNPSPPDMSAVRQQFDVVPAGDQSRNQSSTLIVNGRISQQNIFSHLYFYRLTPQSAGQLTIPPLSVTIDGETITTEPISLRVLEAEQQDLVVAEIRSSHDAVYPTQPFTVTLRILVRPLPDDETTDPMRPLRRRPPHIQVNWVDTPAGLITDENSQWLQPLIADDGAGFTLNEVSTRSGSIFEGPRAAVFDLLQGREQRDALDGRSVNYFVYELSRTFTPQKAGIYRFGPAVIKGTFVSGSDGRDYTGRRLVTIGEALAIEVREVPSPRPATFCGAIGRYQVSASAAPTRLRVGDPLTLTIELQRGSGSGSLELISAPDLSAIPELINDFELIDRNPTGRTESDLKRFTYALRPKRQGASIPPLTVTAFDPQKEEFFDLTTQPVALEVTSAAAISPDELIGSAGNRETTDLQTRSQGIFQNITDLSELQNDAVQPVFWIGLVGTVWLTSAGVMAFVLVSRRRSANSGWIRRQQASRNASGRLAKARELQQQGDSAAALQEIRMSIVGLIADLRNQNTDTLTTSDIAFALKQDSVPDDDRNSVLHLLESIDSAQYGSDIALNPADAAATASDLIDRLTSRLQRRVQ